MLEQKRIDVVLPLSLSMHASNAHGEFLRMNQYFEFKMNNRKWRKIISVHWVLCMLL